jgi:alpha-1,4-digalacturonate transport system permease protein
MSMNTLFAFVMNLPERPMRFLQGVLKGGRLGWVFVAPNLVVFALFTFLPIAFDIHYSVTGGVNLLPSQRPYVGAENFSSLLDCANHFDANSCERGMACGTRCALWSSRSASCWASAC